MRVAAIALLVLVAGACQREAPEQPLPFSHAVHVSRHAIACTRCHPGAERGVEAGLPSLNECLSCHMRPRSEEGKEPRDSIVRERAAKPEPFRWVQVTRNPGHVYFSHRAHTTFAKMKCEECHGDVSSWAEAPRFPNPQLVDMDACMSCHRQRGASNECEACHR